MWLAIGFLLGGVAVAAFAADLVDVWFDRLFCGPGGCYPLLLTLSGWAFAALPLAACVVAPRYAVHVCAFLLGFLGCYFWTGAADHPWQDSLWPLPVTYFVVFLLAAPGSWGLAWLFARTSRARLAVAAAFHWVLLAGIIVWLA
ncbi:hypothetical protein [Lentzea sp. NBRC 105346]|uniref:hypothetical protein n=1 Tax=Lentzea sp. NBRC 105346 TaxID=3032205 RepID=UPI0025533A4D|nr:hypothetical protein [Lentzea sp. NBRC 105346]